MSMIESTAQFVVQPAGVRVRIADLEDELGLRKGAKKRFASRLWALIRDPRRGWNQSELARRAGLGRDSISSYLRQKQFPELAAQEKLAQAFGMGVEELMAGVYGSEEDAQDNTTPPVLEARETRPGFMMLRINKEVPAALAGRILAILFEAERTEGADANPMVRIGHGLDWGAQS